MTETENTANQPPIILADYFLRALAFLIDSIIIAPFSLIIGLVAFEIIYNNHDIKDPMFDFRNKDRMLNDCFRGTTILIYMLYSIFFDSSGRQGTWGKQIMGIKVTDLNGNKITVARATGRFFAHYISAIILGTGFLLPLVTNKRQTLHDLICGCLAVKKTDIISNDNPVPYTNLADDLKVLHELYNNGHLSESEFEKAKAKLLG